jgi:hypothetical protein
MTSQIRSSRQAIAQQLVAQGYDQIADEYLAWAQAVRPEERARYMEALLGRVEAGARVLDLGRSPFCGSSPRSRQDSDRHGAARE